MSRGIKESLNYEVGWKCCFILILSLGSLDSWDQVSDRNGMQIYSCKNEEGRKIVRGEGWFDFPANLVADYAQDPEIRWEVDKIFLKNAELLRKLELDLHMNIEEWEEHLFFLIGIYAQLDIEK